MSALNSNNTFDGLDEPVRPTPGVENTDWTKKITKNNKKEGSQVARYYPLWDVNVTCVYQ